MPHVRASMAHETPTVAEIREQISCSTEQTAHTAVSIPAPEKQTTPNRFSLWRETVHSSSLQPSSRGAQLYRYYRTRCSPLQLPRVTMLQSNATEHATITVIRILQRDGSQTALLQSVLHSFTGGQQSCYLTEADRKRSTGASMTLDRPWNTPAQMHTNIHTYPRIH